jgi:hypothetical protein
MLPRDPSGSRERAIENLLAGLRPRRSVFGATPRDKKFMPAQLYSRTAIRGRINVTQRARMSIVIPCRNEKGNIEQLAHTSGVL